MIQPLLSSPTKLMDGASNDENHFHRARSPMSMPAISAPDRSLIYVVDDVPELTELYAMLLEGRGHIVRAFNDRIEALAALKADSSKPALLITDYRGLSVPVDRFVHQCLLVHPPLRILIASGFSEADMFFSEATPARFMQKPFTPEDLWHEVEAVLAA